MKKFFIILLLVLTACSSDDSDNSFLTADILGTWQLTETEQLKYYGDCYPYHSKTFEFGQRLYSRGYSGINCRNEYESKKIYNLEGDVLTITAVNGGYNGVSDYIEKYYILSLTETKLILELYFVDEGFADPNYIGSPKGTGPLDTFQRLK
jgi:hypothetical protein